MLRRPPYRLCASAPAQLGGLGIEAQHLSVGLLVITGGGRDPELLQMAESFADEPFDERLLVANGTAVPDLDGWTVLEAPANLGVPGGRSHGMACATSDVVVVVDDDSVAVGTGLVEQVREIFGADSRLGALALHVVVVDTDRSLPRWIPAHRDTTAHGLAKAATFPGNGHVLRRSAFDDVGGYTDEFFFKHEETELSWKLLDAEWQVGYAPHVKVAHPETLETRNPIALATGTRNKLWLARLLLPRPLSWATITIATARAFLGVRSRADVGGVASGTKQGLGALPRPRSPITWKTVAELSRRGRPPLT